jgi:transcriptional regulator with XRE-family HTH domain
MPNWSALNNRERRKAVRQGLLGRELNDEDSASLQNAEIVQEAARFLRQMREEADLTQEQLGKKLGMSQARICELERGGTPEGMSYAILRRAAIACNLTDWPPAPTRRFALSSAGVRRVYDRREGFANVSEELYTKK